jgi:thiaminase/transcriptional activator TenA
VVARTTCDPFDPESSNNPGIVAQVVRSLHRPSGHPQPAADQPKRPLTRPSATDNFYRRADFLRFAEGAIVVERALHESYFEEIGVPDGLEQSPACSFEETSLLATVAHHSLEEAIAALLPCFWIYREVGHAIDREAAPDNAYRRWIDTYAGADFATSVDRAITITDAVAATASDTGRDRMRAAYVTSSRLEWMFWDSAYRMERWPP